MKKIIISMFAFFGLLMVAPSLLEAQTYERFNTHPSDMATVLVSNATSNPCSSGAVTGCWKSSVSANPGDIIAVQVYFHNSTNTVAENSTASIKPRSTALGTTHTFSGGVASTTIDRATGSASVSTATPQTLTFIPGSVCIYMNSSPNECQWVPDEEMLFSTSGLSLGTIPPGSATQGVLVANYRVSNNTYVPPTQPDTCSINSFSVDRGSINRGETTVLRWTTSGANRVDISTLGSNLNTSGSLLVSPIGTTTYTLTAYGNSCSRSQSVTVYVNNVQNNTRPTAITNNATLITATSAKLNGIAIPSANLSTIAWFEWGTTQNLGLQTPTQNVGSASSTAFSRTLTSLAPNTTYFYRAVVQNTNGTAYGQIVSFRTATAPIKPVKPVVIPKTVKQTVVAKSTPSLLEVRVESIYDRMCVGGEIEYVVTYRNISKSELVDTVLQVSHQKELAFINATRGDYSAPEQTLTIGVGRLMPGEEGSVRIRGRVVEGAIEGTLLVTTATLVYTNPATRAQEDAIAYSLTTVSTDCPSDFGKTTKAGGWLSFFPHTLGGWLLLILIILALIVLIRQISKKNQ